MHNIRKVGVLALVAALMMALAALHPALETPEAEANLGFPGGITALPSAVPAIPGQANQSVPAIIGTGQPGIVAVFCFSTTLPAFGGPCPGGLEEPDQQGTPSGAITFEITRIYPDDAPSGLTFDANGERSLVVTDNSGADKDAALGVVAVRVNAAAATQGGTQGVNEIVEIRATDSTGDMRSVQMVVVDTMLSWGPTGPLSTAAQEQPQFVSYHCDTLGRSPLVAGTLAWQIDPDTDNSQGLDDMYDALYAAAYGTLAPGLGYGSNTLAGDLDLPDVWCGGDTPNSLFDDFVGFQTDLGLFSSGPVGQALREGAMGAATSNVFLPAIVDVDCDIGKSVNVFDVDALTAWWAWLFDDFGDPILGSTGFEGGCDADGWRNGVVTQMLLGNGDVGTATITGQQGGGVSPVRTVYATFIGLPALSLMLEAPATMGLEGGDFTVAVVDPSFRFVGDETISCTLEPTESGFIIVPQTGTTGGVTSESPAQVTMHIVPTGASVVAGEKLTITCVLDRYRSVKATGFVTLVSFETESVDLVEGCNPLAATWPDATPIADVVAGVAPAEALDAIWLFDPASGAWMGYSPAAPEASDLESVNNLDAIFVCVNAAATISRPVI
jgi:hypothetical protein